MLKQIVQIHGYFLHIHIEIQRTTDTVIYVDCVVYIFFLYLHCYSIIHNFFSLDLQTTPALAVETVSFHSSITYSLCHMKLNLFKVRCK